MKPLAVTTENLSFSYGKEHALSDLSLEIQPGTITGLLGRNGSGKSTLSMLLAGQDRGSGSLKVGGVDPFENPDIMPNVAYLSESTAVYYDSVLNATLSVWSAVRPDWSDEIAGNMLDKWGLNPKKAKPSQLSRGQQSAFFATLGLASRAALTIFDEVHLGMDAVVRREFYDALLSDFVMHPRTIILSSHLINEIEDLLENVVFLHAGRLLASGEADAVRAEHSGDHLASLTDVLISLSKEQS